MFRPILSTAVIGFVLFISLFSYFIELHILCPSTQIASYNVFQVLVRSTQETLQLYLVIYIKQTDSTQGLLSDVIHTSVASYVITQEIYDLFDSPV
jgi:hypothetical protein